jgi:cell division protein FtsQ
LPSLGRRASPVTIRRSVVENTIGRAKPAHVVLLPRLLWKPVRRLARFAASGEVYAPRNLIFVGLIAVVAAATFGVRASGGLEAIAAKATAASGIRIGDIDVIGGKEVSKIDVLSAIDLGPDRSLFTFDLLKARQELRALPWVSDATLAKVYPDTLTISLIEKVPFAVWQREEELWLIARDGGEIVPFDDRFGRLPLVVGSGANSNAAQILSIVERHPAIGDRISAFVRVGDRRWNIVLKDNVTLMLPEHGVENALIRFSEFLAEHDLLALDIDHVDMRLDDRVVLGLTSGGKESFDAFVNLRARQVKGGSDG